MPEPEIVQDDLTPEEARALRLQRRAFREALDEHEDAKKKAREAKEAADRAEAERRAAEDTPKPKVKSFGIGAFLP